MSGRSTGERKAGAPHPYDGDAYRLMVEGVRDYAIFMLDPEGVIATWNEGAQRIKGYAASEIIGQHFSRFYPADALAKGWPDEELRRARELGRFEDEHWRIRKDGSRFWANVIITALRNAKGELIGFSKITRDLTERRAQEELLRQSEENSPAPGRGGQGPRDLPRRPQRHRDELERRRANACSASARPT